MRLLRPKVFLDTCLAMLAVTAQEACSRWGKPDQESAAAEEAPVQARPETPRCAAGGDAGCQPGASASTGAASVMRRTRHLESVSTEALGITAAEILGPSPDGVDRFQQACGLLPA